MNVFGARKPGFVAVVVVIDRLFPVHRAQLRGGAVAGGGSAPAVFADCREEGWGVVFDNIFGGG
jgi:hypothetical protein